MKILQDKGKRSLTFVTMFAAFTHCARGRIEKESSIVSLAVVVASDPESQRPNQNQQSRRERPPPMMGIDKRRVKRRKVRPPFVIGPFEGSQSGVRSESTQQNNDGQQLQPPRISTHRSAEMTISPRG